MSTIVDHLSSLPEAELREMRAQTVVELRQLDAALARKGLPPPTSSRRVRPGGTRQRVMDAIRDHGPMSPSEVMAELESQDVPAPKAGAVYNMMTRLVSEGDLVRDHGQYDLPPEVNPFTKKLGKRVESRSTTPPIQEAT